MNIDQLIARRRQEADAKLARRNAIAEELGSTSLDAARRTDLRTEQATLDGQIDAIERTLKELLRQKAEDEYQLQLAREITPTGAQRPAYDSVARVGGEARTYRPDDDRAGRPSFLMDLARAQVYRDPSAAERLAQHTREMFTDRPELATNQRAIGTSAVVGLVPPQYLTDLYAELARAGRPVANACRRLPLPDKGMTVNISRVTTGTSAASQATQNSAVSETNADDTLLTVDVNTIAGQQTVSRQAVERGVLVEEVVMADLANAHNAELDRQVINGSGASGQHLGILGTSGIISVAYTDASPTVPELWPKLVDAVRQVAAQRFTRATHLVFNPLAWGWLLSEKDTTGRPLFSVGGSSGAFNTMGASDNAGYELSGEMLGADVIVSGNVPTNLGAGTNETRIIAADMRDAFLWEDAAAPLFIRAEQTNAASLGVTYVAYSYSAFTAGRQPKAVAVVSGTGLILPSL